MTVNHGGTLTQDYFKSYIKLIITANECSSEEAKNIAFKQLFGEDENRFGQETYKNFLLAYKELKTDISGEW
ncbi:hypothetical protein [Virgibacillus halodenitrificans]|uniref:hypothetical protein n=1 Tax=Virgibacillus halodenitrificans TaxID=1482 RepID=UPI00031D153A|nr:hypothetical protein [Virgibacillus halodenitrificans]WHX25123.1 hypothetical protein QNH47_13195 [Virgibacillus halodenitrificans]